MRRWHSGSADGFSAAKQEAGHPFCPPTLSLLESSTVPREASARSHRPVKDSRVPDSHGLGWSAGRRPGSGQDRGFLSVGGFWFFKVVHTFTMEAGRARPPGHIFQLPRSIRRGEFRNGSLSPSTWPVTRITYICETGETSVIHVYTAFPRVPQVRWISPVVLNDLAAGVRG